MSKKAPKKMFCFFIMLLVAILVFGVLTFISPMILLTHEDKILEKDLNNSIIDDGFSNWKSANIKFFEDFWIPSTWLIFSSSGEITLEDEEGNILGKGTLLGQSGSKYACRDDFVAAIFDSDSLDISEDYIPGFVPINGSTFGKMIVTNDNSVDIIYYLSLISLTENASEELFIVFSNHMPYNLNEIEEISQAIVYSFCFPVTSD